MREGVVLALRSGWPRSDFRGRMRPQSEWIPPIAPLISGDPQATTESPAIFIVGPPPKFTARGYVCEIEDDRLLVSLIGRFIHPPADLQGFFDFARSLHNPLIYQLLNRTDRLTDIAHYRFPASTCRHYERMSRFPEGFLVIGDAVCCFNPVYGQGLSAAALQVRALRQVLNEHASDHGLDGIAPVFFSKVAEVNSAPWVLAANLDLAYPQTRGERPPESGAAAWRTRESEGMIKSDRWIRRMAVQQRMIEPFEPGQVREVNGHRKRKNEHDTLRRLIGFRSRTRKSSGS